MRLSLCGKSATIKGLEDETVQGVGLLVKHINRLPVFRNCRHCIIHIAWQHGLNRSLVY